MPSWVKLRCRDGGVLRFCMASLSARRISQAHDSGRGDEEFSRGSEKGGLVYYTWDRDEDSSCYSVLARERRSRRVKGGLS